MRKILAAQKNGNLFLKKLSLFSRKIPFLLKKKYQIKDGPHMMLLL
jgi:hypothetical protein